MRLCEVLARRSDDQVDVVAAQLIGAGACVDGPARRSLKRSLTLASSESIGARWASGGRRKFIQKPGGPEGLG
jgi:hypothetical protein